MSAFPAGVTFFSGKKESHQRKLPGGRERVGAERSDGPSLRWALGSLIGGWWRMPVSGWFYRSFANSFTLCLIWFTRASLSAVPFLYSLTCWVWAGESVAVAPRWFFSLFDVSPLCPPWPSKERVSNCQQCLKPKRTDQAEREAVGERRVEPASL